MNLYKGKISGITYFIIAKDSTDALQELEEARNEWDTNITVFNSLVLIDEYIKISNNVIKELKDA